jgi:energy-coupling factor transport system permease protein
LASPEQGLAAYVPRPTWLDAASPFTKLIWLGCAVVWAVVIPSPPVLAALALATAALAPLAQVGRPFAVMLWKIALPLLVALALVQGFLVYGFGYALLQGLRLLVVMETAFLFVLTTHPAKLVASLLARRLPNTVGYVVLATLQSVPMLQRRAATILDAQRARGLEVEGGLVTRLRAYLPLIAPLVLSALSEVDERALALETRAFSVPGPKTHLDPPREAPSDRAARWLLAAATLAIVPLRVLVWR